MRSDKKMFIFTLGVLLVIIASGIGIKNYLQIDTAKLNSKIDTINKAIEKNDWKNAHTNIKELKKDWESSQKIWALFINHREIDNISSSLCKTEEYILNNSLSDSSAYLAELKEFIDHIPDMEKLSLKNIL